MQFQYPFQLGDHQLNIALHGEGYELRIDSQSFLHLYNTRKASKRVTLVQRRVRWSSEGDSRLVTRSTRKLLPTTETMALRNLTMMLMTNLPPDTTPNRLQATGAEAGTVAPNETPASRKEIPRLEAQATAALPAEDTEEVPVEAMGEELWEATEEVLAADMAEEVTETISKRVTQRSSTART